MYAGDLDWYPSKLDVGKDDHYGHGRKDCLDLKTSHGLVPYDAPQATREAAATDSAEVRIPSAPIAAVLARVTMVALVRVRTRSRP